MKYLKTIPSNNLYISLCIKFTYGKISPLKEQGIIYYIFFNKLANSKFLFSLLQAVSDIHTAIIYKKKEMCVYNKHALILHIQRRRLDVSKYITCICPYEVQIQSKAESRTKIGKS